MSGDSYVEFLDHWGKEFTEIVQYYKKKAERSKDVLLGLLLGILGNMAVQYWYPLFENLIPLEAIVWSNAIIFIVICVSIIYLVYTFFGQIKFATSSERHYEALMTKINQKKKEELEKMAKEAKLKEVKIRKLEETHERELQEKRNREKNERMKLIEDTTKKIMEEIAEKREAEMKKFEKETRERLAAEMEEKLKTRQSEIEKEVRKKIEAESN